MTGPLSRGLPITHETWGGFEVGETPEERAAVRLLRTVSISLTAEVLRLRVQLKALGVEPETHGAFAGMAWLNEQDTAKRPPARGL